MQPGPVAKKPTPRPPAGNWTHDHGSLHQRTNWATQAVAVNLGVSSVYIDGAMSVQKSIFWQRTWKPNISIKKLAIVLLLSSLPVCAQNSQELYDLRRGNLIFPTICVLFFLLSKKNIYVAQQKYFMIIDACEFIDFVC